MSRTLFGILALCVPTGCSTSTTVDLHPCQVTLEWLLPAAAEPGATITVGGTPFTTAYDTAVYAGAERATLIEMDTSRCDACNQCYEDEYCSGCDDCDACAETCSTCIDTVTFTLPTVEPGKVPVQLFNRHGDSNVIEMTVLAPEVGDTGDTGQDETGTGETGKDETAAPDSGDTAPADSGDTAPADSGDTAPADTAMSKDSGI